MGFSFVSLAEIVYHCFLCIVLLFRKKRALFKKKQAQKTRRKNASILENSYQLDNPGKPLYIFSNEKKSLHIKKIDIWANCIFWGAIWTSVKKQMSKSQKWSFWNCPKLFGPDPTGAMLRKYLCTKKVEHKFINALEYE